MALWMIIPLVLFLNLDYLKRKNYAIYIGYLFYISLIIISLIYRNSLLEFEVSGPNVEQWTIILVSGHFLILIFIQNKKVNSDFCSEKMLTTVFLILISIFVADLVARYLMNPACFMNYSCRYEAKTIGFYSTSNVSGQSLSALILAGFFLRIKWKRLIIVTLSIILVTTMARAAIVSTAIFLLMAIVNYIFRKNKIILIFGYGAVSFGLILFFIIDPLGFKNDGSALSKLDFFFATYNVVTNGSYMDFLLGYGGSYDQIVNLINVNGWSPHATILKSTLYYGAVGLFLYFYMYFSAIKLDLNSFYAISAFYVLGLTGAPIYWPGLAGIYVMFYMNRYDDKN
nr:hypothetical protein BCU82_13155 [Vibrio cyclitrophicus]